jgi:hypothetical protein
MTWKVAPGSILNLGLMVVVSVVFDQHLVHGRSHWYAGSEGYIGERIHVLEDWVGANIYVVRSRGRQIGGNTVVRSLKVN